MIEGSAAESANPWNPHFSTAVRGYDRAAVDEVIAYETARMRELHERAAVLEREIAALQATAGIPHRNDMVRRALGAMATGWDEAAQMASDAQYVAARERANAEAMVSVRRAVAHQQMAAAEAATQAEADRLVAGARREAAQILAHASEQHDRALAAASALGQATVERSQENARQFAHALCGLDEDVTAEVADRQALAEEDLVAAEMQLQEAGKDVAAIAERALAQREAILAQARAYALASGESTASEILRVQKDTDHAVAELAELMFSFGGELNQVRQGRFAAAAEHAPWTTPMPAHVPFQPMNSAGDAPRRSA